MKERMIASSVTVAATLAFYYYGKTHTKDAIPYLIAGEVVGVLLGEIVATAVRKSKH